VNRPEALCVEIKMFCVKNVKLLDKPIGLDVSPWQGTEVKDLGKKDYSTNFVSEIMNQIIIHHTSPSCVDSNMLFYYVYNT
jgi:hypothetical protein